MAIQGEGLFGAVGDPEEVVEFLGVARVGVVGAFVFVFDVGASGLHGFSFLAGGVGGAAVDGAGGGFGKGGGGEGEGQGQRYCSGNQDYTEKLFTHSWLR